MMTQEQAREFCDRFLPAWSGNHPDKLAGFYAEDALYSDPAVRDGLKGREAILKYFEKLLARNPDWIWTHLEAFPMEDGFLNKWLAHIPTAGGLVKCIGVCTVQFNKTGLIRRNEVYFDRSEWVASVRMS